MKKPALILAHQGLGDHIVCNGLYRSLAIQHSYCVIPVVRRYFDEISKMLEDESRIMVYSVPNSYWQEYFIQLQKQFKKKYRIVNLGSFGIDFMKDRNVRLDASFYRQADVPLENRWSHFYFPRDPLKEQSLLSELTTPETPYIFLHEDKGRHFTIDRSLIRRDMPIVTPVLESSFFLTNYSKVIENATEIHCIESSFAAFIESINPNGKKFAHRYARPEARDDFRFEYTYKTQWSIIR